jgi:hypothetical protein
LESTLLKVKLRKQRRECSWRATLIKSWVGWTIQIRGILETRHGTNHNLCDEDEFVCGLLEWYFIAFIKTFACSRVYSFGRLLALQQLEVELCKSWVAINNASCWLGRSTHFSLLWAQELEASSHIHPI